MKYQHNATNAMTSLQREVLLDLYRRGHGMSIDELIENDAFILAIPDAWLDSPNNGIETVRTELFQIGTSSFVEHKSDSVFAVSKPFSSISVSDDCSRIRLQLAPCAIKAITQHGEDAFLEEFSF